jgi:hypothetical protein
MKRVREMMTRFRGLQLSAAKIHMDPGELQVAENLSVERIPGTRVRAGYARMLDEAGGTINVAPYVASRLFSFERTDNVAHLVVGVTHYPTDSISFVEAFELGDPEWT